MLRYWFELRTRLIYSIACYVTAWAVGAVFYQHLFSVLSHLWQQAPYQLVVTDIQTGVGMPWQIAGAFAIWLTMPILGYQFAMFIAPALYPDEKRHLYAIIGWGSGLFLLGTAFGLWFVMPWLIDLARSWAPAGVIFLPSVGTLIVLTEQVALISGLLFEVPLLLYLLLASQWLEVESLRAKRGIWVTAIFFVSMLVTPPDVVSQLCLALPLWLSIECVMCLHVFVSNPSE